VRNAGGPSGLFNCAFHRQSFGQRRASDTTAKSYMHALPLVLDFWCSRRRQPVETVPGNVSCVWHRVLRSSRSSQHQSFLGSLLGFVPEELGSQTGSTGSCRLWNLVPCVGYGFEFLIDGRCSNGVVVRNESLSLEWVLTRYVTEVCWFKSSATRTHFPLIASLG
jgi:hypothetical protein